MKQCKECGVFSQDDTVFCYVCGKKLPEMPDVAIETSQSETQYSEQVIDNQAPAGYHTSFVSQIYVRTRDEGGRHTPFFNGYRPQFIFGATDVTGIISLPEGIEMCMPGDSVEVIIELLQPIAIEQGLTFNICEGGRIVGHGEVQSIIG